MLFSLIDLYHNINKFLGTVAGELLKRSAELILLTVVTYMIFSEYRREKLPQLKYLMIGFAMLGLQRLIMTFVLADIVFVKVNPNILLYIPILAHFLEVAGFLLIANAFICHILNKHINFRKRIRIELFLTFLIFAFAEIVWLIKLNHIPMQSWGPQLMLIAFEGMKVIICAYPIFILLKNKQYDKYSKNTIAAFLILMIAPMTYLLNHVLYFGQNSYFRVFAHPFPFIAILLFTRVVYLKLVDKATLREELSETRRKYLEMVEVSKMKDDFLSTVSHELRTPLTSMGLYLSLLKDGKFGDVNDKQKESIGIVQNENQRLANLISDILSLSKLESKKLKLNIKKCNLFRITSDKFYKNLTEEKKITVINNIPNDFGIQVDPEKFKQVYINLFTNAVKYTEHEGTIKLNAKKDKEHWEFSVSDNGIGIPPENLPKIFSKFYQVEDHMTREEGGTGLGLPITKHIVEMHGGEISVKSKVDKGSTFIVKIPNAVTRKK